MNATESVLNVPVARLKPDEIIRANSCVRKPVDFIQFIDVARRLGLWWLVLNEIPPLYKSG